MHAPKLKFVVQRNLLSPVHGRNICLVKLSSSAAIAAEAEVSVIPFYLDFQKTFNYE